MPPTEVKQLGIKVGTVRRTKKEYDMYLKEETAQRSKIGAMKMDGADEADVNKQMEVLNDTLTVIPDTRQRLQRYTEELSDFLKEHFQDVEVTAAGSGEPADEAQNFVLEGRQLLQEIEAILGDGATRRGSADASGRAKDGDTTAGGTGQCEEF
mmetsp:Transcript_87715/g.204087  ORF Transcript_87715/g.204087 Transcript_87715/m.204087 type:complete len:154 (-) Transcript_87715:68-529(-)|eukprot:CAMPEP_0171101706 /NCGR_PEP_ID=MMETSP0766_2-20121228/55765_1 /TAXON_ID=439317 /ORGANISM="Gambierdiscus australes, Strain CAWD 149" /LENGTH=153 /DNA_ID=CAMNT_0011561827 /DNA_START=154 /DNA_END=615 /DNA_ORIENTATION=+